MCHATLANPRFVASRRASASMASVASNPVARRTWGANAHTTEPGPHATSRETSSGRGRAALDEDIERGLVVQRWRGCELLGLAGELIGDGGVVGRGGSGGHWRSRM